MPRFPKSRIAKINAARKAAKVGVRRNGVRKAGVRKKKVVEKDKTGTRSISTAVAEIPVNGYTIHHFPNLGLFVKAKYETWLTAKGFQPSRESLIPLSKEFVSRVLAAKIRGEL